MGLNLPLRSSVSSCVSESSGTLSQHTVKLGLNGSHEGLAEAFRLTFCMMWLTQGDVQLLRSGP